MKLLISPINEEEAQEAILGGADIVDVKNPKEGPLGASFPWIIQNIKKAAPKTMEVSCTLGDVPNLPGTAALAALGAASTGVDYIKVGLGNLKTPAEAVALLQAVVRAAKTQNPHVKVVAAGYADAEAVGSINPLLIPGVASEAKCDVAMLDTAVKNDKTLLDALTRKDLGDFVEKTHGYKLQAALAGSLKAEHLSFICGLGADIVGLRGAACTGGDRVNGKLTRENVAHLVEAAQKLNRKGS
jgi:(5-formylfuran-3-yl)methyl phosphate synthase